MTPSLTTLPSGLRVVLVPCEAESVAFGLFIASGSRHETDATAGISHLIEHMLFKGTPTRKPIDITRAIEGRGGNFNACTGEESTCYYAHLPHEYLKEAVEILSDMYLNATIDPEEFKREKEVVLEEIKMYADEPDSVAQENLQRALFPQHPLGRPVAGSAASLVPLTPKDLKAYIRAHYVPANTVAVVVGRFDATEALDLITRALVRRDTAPASLSHAPTPFFPVVNEVTTTKEAIHQTQLALGYRTFGVTDPRKYAAVVLDAILGRGMSSRLFQEVREKRGLSYDIASRLHFFDETGMLTIAAGVDPGKAETVLKVIDREVEKLCQKRVSAAELKRTKEFLVGNFRLSHERIVSKLFFYGSTVLSFNRLLTTEEQVAGVRAVTAAEVQAVARDIFKPENRSLSRVLPRA